MQPLSGNQRPDLLTSLMNMSLVLRLPRKMNASLQILCRFPTPAIVFGHATKPSRFAHFWQGARSLAPDTRNDIWTPKSAPKPSVFYTFDFEMCFAPQRRALFEHLNFWKCSGAEVFCTFWLGNVLRAATACNFSSLIWPAGSAPAVLASLLFDPPEPQIIGKNTVFRNFPTFSGTWIFFLLRLSLFDLLSPSLLWLFPSLLFICFYCGKFDF